MTLAQIIQTIVQNNPAAVLGKLHGWGLAEQHSQLDYTLYASAMSSITLQSTQQYIDAVVESVDVPVLPNAAGAEELNQLQGQHQAPLRDIVRGFAEAEITGKELNITANSDNLIVSTKRAFKAMTTDQKIVAIFAMVGVAVTALVIIKIFIKIAQNIFSDEK